MYEYKSRLYGGKGRENDGVIDGDTVDMEVDLGFYNRFIIRIRVKNIDTAEIHGVPHDSDEYKKGKKQTEFVREWFEEGVEEFDGDWPFIVNTEMDRGAYRRWIADIERRSDGSMLTEAVLEEWPDAKY